MGLKNWMYDNYFRLPEWVKKWLFPGYAWSNLLHRTDIVKIPGASPTEYHEYDWRLTAAVFELVSDFVESEERSPVVDWEATGPAALADWNSMKEIRDWWRTGRDRALQRHQRLLEFYSKWYAGQPEFGEPDERGMVAMTFTCSALPKTREEFDIAFDEDDWKVFDEFFADRSKVVEKSAIRNLVNELDDYVRVQDTRYLKMAIDVRERMWT